MQSSSFQQPMINANSMGSRISPMRITGYDYNYNQKHPSHITQNNYVGQAQRQIPRNSSVSPDSKQNTMNQNKKKMSGLSNNNSNFNRVSDKPPKDIGGMLIPQSTTGNGQQQQSYQRASSVNRYTQKHKYGQESKHISQDLFGFLRSGKNSQMASNSSLKDESSSIGQDALKKSSSFKVGGHNSSKIQSYGTRVNDSSIQQHNSSFNMNIYSSNGSQNTTCAITDFLNHSYNNTNSSSYNPSSQMSHSSDRRLQQRRKASSSHQNQFIGNEHSQHSSLMNTNSVNISAIQSSLSQHPSAISPQPQLFHINSSYLDHPPFQDQKKAEVQRGGVSQCFGDENVAIPQQLRDSGFGYSSNNSNNSNNSMNINNNNQSGYLNKNERGSFSKKKESDIIGKYSQASNKNDLNMNHSQQTYNKYSTGNSQPLKVLPSYQNIPCEFNVFPTSINIIKTPASGLNLTGKNLIETDIANRSPLQKGGSEVIYVPQYINQGASAVSSGVKQNLQGTNKLNASFNFSKDSSTGLTEGSQNIEEMHFYAVDFQQNCKKWLSQIEQQF